jgi:hypothetical protein
LLLPPPYHGHSYRFTNGTYKTPAPFVLDLLVTP